MFRSLAFTVLIILVPAVAPSQSADDRYFDFWPGAWHRVEDGKRDAEPSFVVTHGVNRSAFEESWRLRGDGGEVLVSRALRTWDTATRKWMFAWTSAEGLFQVWDGVKVGADWYIQREFEQNGKRFLSRQGWIPQSPNRVERIMERSFDDGGTWQLRSRTTFERVP